MTDGNEHAFATTDGSTAWQAGLTKREYFAAMAMQGFLASLPNKDWTAIWEENLGVTTIAAHSTMIADALIEALNEEAK